MSFYLLFSALASYCELDDLFTIARLLILKIHCFIVDYCLSVRVYSCSLLVSLSISSIVSSLQSYLLTHHFILIVCVLFVPWFTLSAMLFNCWSDNLPIFLYLQISVCCVLNLLIWACPFSYLHYCFCRLSWPRALNKTEVN